MLNEIPELIHSGFAIDTDSSKLLPSFLLAKSLSSTTRFNTHTQLKLEPTTVKQQNIQLTQRLSFLFPAIVFLPKMNGKHVIYHLQHLPEELRSKVPSHLRA